MEKKITLRKLELKNFRGQNHIVEFNEKETRISGRNGIGKSTIMKGWLWLLTSYTSPTELRNFNLFDNRIDLSPDTPKASVKAYITIDGWDYTLERTAEAKFVRRRGSNEYEKANTDVYETKIDEIEMSASDFTAWVERNIAPADMLPYCLDGGFFISLLDDKNKARKTLERIIGEINEGDMCGDYSVIAEDMKRYSIEQIEERTKSELKPYRQRIDEIPAVIEETEKSLAEYDAINFEQILADIEKTKRDIDDLDDAILGKGKEIEPIMGERNRIYALISDKISVMTDKRREYNDRSGEGQREAYKELDEANKRNRELEGIMRSRQAEWDACVEKRNRERKNLDLLESQRERLVGERDEVKARVFTAERCAYCGQELPADEIEKAKEKFNEKKRADYETIVARGKNIADMIKASREQIAEYEKVIERGVEWVEMVDTKRIKERISAENAKFIPYEETDEYRVLKAEIADLEASLPEIPSDDSTALTGAKRVLMTTLEGLNRQYGLKAKADDMRNAIVGLRSEMRELGITIAKLEGKIDKCREYRQEKADIISFRVNDKLDDCRIDMWSPQKDGTLVPDVVLRGKDGVRFQSLNFSHQIKAKIELSRLFCSHYGVSLPAFIDEASCFDSGNVPKLDSQSVLLWASDSPYLNVD